MPKTRNARRCKKHKRKDSYRPTSNCLHCLLDWLEENPSADIRASDLLRLIEAYHLNIVDWQVRALWATTKDDQFKAIVDFSKHA